jgi:NitT/TauT family transport system ATP-binding protein
MDNNMVDIPPKINMASFNGFQRINKDRSTEIKRSIPILSAINVKKKFRDHVAIPDLNFQIEDIEGKSEVISIIGPSGCGKSTLLKLIAGLIYPTEGEIRVFDKKIEGPGMDRGMIFQKYSSFKFLNVIQNISYPLIHVMKKKKKDAYDIAKYWIDKMFLTGAEYKYPYELSGGMQQRVAIARTLSMNANIILMDEPFGALDRKIRWEMQDLLAEILFLNPVQEITVFLVTHDIPEAVYLGDRVWVFHKGQIIDSQFVDRPFEPARKMQGNKEFFEIVSYFNEKIDHLELVEENNE